MSGGTPGCLDLIIDNSRGIFFDNCNDNSFTDNDVVDNDLALQLMGNGERNKIIHNNFINNLGNLVLDGKRTDTEWTGDEGGNYWSDYQGYDLDGDGLGDVPHILQNVFQVLERVSYQIDSFSFCLYTIHRGSGLLLTVPVYLSTLHEGWDFLSGYHIV